MSHLKQGDRVWISQDPYDEDLPQAGNATVTGAPENGLVWVQFDPVLVSVDRIQPQPTRQGTVK